MANELTKKEQAAIDFFGTNDFQMMWIEAEFRAKGDLEEMHRIVNESIKEAIPEGELLLQDYLNKGSFLHDDEKMCTQLLHNGRRFLAFGFPDGPEGEFVVARLNERLSA